ncbi:MAG: hypothetical protein LBB75_03710 [Oscillospiraceae bacterium]|jgi:hypothetical protein|nr:hypothetical protein [Oscillospiraceae bacterium]
MQKLCVPFLTAALLLCLAACGKPAPASPATAPATAIETTMTQSAETTALPEATQPMKAKSRPLMETDAALVYATLYDTPELMGYTKEIWLRDKATGAETLLLEKQRRDSGRYDMHGNKMYGEFLPRFEGEIDERYFAFRYDIPESDGAGSTQFYDLQKLREIQVDYGGYKVGFEVGGHVADGKIYLHTWVEDDSGDAPNFAIDIASLDGGGPILPQEVH